MRILLITALIAGNAIALRMNPVEIIIGKLRNNRNEIEKEARQDQADFEKSKCTDESTRDNAHTKFTDAKEKFETEKKNFEKANAASGAAKAAMEDNQGKSKSAFEQLASTQTALNEAQQKFNADSTYAKESIEGLQAALAILKGGKSFIQNPHQLASVKAALVQGIESGYNANPQEVKLVQSLLQGAGTVGDGAYASQAGGVTGILKSMYDNAQEDLEQLESSNDEKSTLYNRKIESLHKDMQGFDTASERESAVYGEQAQVAKVSHLAYTAADGVWHTNKDVYETTVAKLAEDLSAFSRRQELRNAELNAVSNAIDAMSSDSSRQTSQKVQFFMQMKTLNAPVVDALVQGSGMDQVAATINEQIKLQTDMMASDKVEYESCVSGLNEANRNKDTHSHNLNNADVAVDSSNQDVKSANDAIDSSQNDIKDNKHTLKVISSDRARKHNSFNQGFQEQTNYQGVLTSGINALRAFYGTKKSAARGAKQNGAGVVKMLNNLMQESKDTVANLQENENADQGMYERQVKDLNASNADEKAAIGAAEGSKGQALENLSAATAQQTESQASLDTTNKNLANLHGDCDFLVKYYTLRRGKAQSEVRSMQQLLSVLAPHGGAEDVTMTNKD